MQTHEWVNLSMQIFIVSASYLFVYLATNSKRKKKLSALIGLGLVSLYLLLNFFTPRNNEAEFYSHGAFLTVVLVSSLFVSRLINRRFKTEEQDWQSHFSERELLNRDLKLAGKIQESLFPNDNIVHGIRFTIFRKTQQQIGGDFYDFVKLREGDVGIFLTDVAGHGVASAMVASMIKVLVATIPYSYKLDPSRLLTYLDKKLSGEFQGSHASALYMYVNFPAKSMIIANAGHPYILYSRQRQDFEELKTEGALLGFHFLDPIAENITMSWQAGDRFVIYTDGLIESINSFESHLENTGLIKILNQNSVIKDLELFKQAVLKDIGLFYDGREFTDDVLLLIFEME
ncbi:MAG TPA: PP2C family protein-serine/threonine phosphatase [Leptospiraceae bacterium]|nr:PP2C family protein-serine/threonine phosphatase [Leptospiraceae bacterium]HMY67283.1 PP2C family protein-serine/threonine phosphatase [Leptospiraceae bacterium]HMZ57919.1 PP2C family protein-serine/threonine phosphatase [Leptospiraceae bacterium]HNF12237.1 PP2C family protein-serine/threonine phosphatase [Leptospiraceae bacterium]HNF23266.1 PP2C family protein-serine/threonine phosphatase [Leptospiraceae bacterium]